MDPTKKGEKWEQGTFTNENSRPSCSALEKTLARKESQERVKAAAAMLVSTEAPLVLMARLRP